MDFLSPVIGSVTGIEPAQWKVILVFSLKVFLFTLPFIVIGLLVEKDMVRVPLANRFIKSIIVFIFFFPVFLFGILNYMAPSLPDSFWEKYPLLENLWIMEGKWPPLLLSGLATIYMLLYISETATGNMVD